MRLLEDGTTRELEDGTDRLLQGEGATLEIQSVAFIAADRVRVTYSSSSVTRIPIHFSTAGFTLTDRAASVSFAGYELTGDYTADLLLSRPSYAGGSPTLAYDAAVGTVGDASGAFADDQAALSVTSTVLNALTDISTTTENRTLPVGGRPYREEIQLQPAVAVYLAVAAIPAQSLSLLVFAPFADCTLNVASSADNGIADTYAARVLRDEKGVAASAPVIPFGVRAKYTLENLTEPYIRLTSAVAALVTVSSQAPLTLLKGAAVL